MSALEILIYVLEGMAVVTLGLLVVFVPLARRLRRLLAEMGRDAAARGETLVRGPEQASFAGATAVYGRIKGTGGMILTDTRLLLRRLVGSEIELARADIVGARTEMWFLGAWNGRAFLVVTMGAGVEVGFAVRDAEAWVVALAQRRDAEART